MDKASIKRFLKWAFKPGDIVELDIMRYGGDEYRYRPTLLYIEPIEAITHRVNSLPNDHLILVGINPRPSNFVDSRERAKDRDILVYKNVYFDFEPTAEGQTADVKTFIKEFLEYLETKYGLNSRSAVVAFTGRGYHILFALPETDRTPMQIYTMFKAMYDGLLQDDVVRNLLSKYKVKWDQTFGPARKAKLYGTKKPLIGYMCSLFPVTKRIISNILDVAEKFPVFPPKPQESVDLEFVHSFEDLWNRVNDKLTLQAYHLGDVFVEDQSRSGKDMAYANWLAGQGFTHSEIAEFLKRAEYNRGKELSEAYLKHTLSKISIREPREEEKRDQYFLSLSDLLEFSEREDNFKIYTGVGKIDNYIQGLYPQELSLCIAKQGTGKTTFCVWQTIQAALQGFNTLYIFYEDRTLNIKNKYIGLLTELKLKVADLTGDLDVYNATEHPLDLERFEEVISKKPYALIVIDYISRITLKGLYPSDRFLYRDIMMRLKNLAQKYYVHFMVMDHVLIYGEQDNNKPEKPYFEDWEIAEAKMYKLMIADVVFGFKRPKRAGFENLLWFSGLKNKRNGVLGYNVPLRVDYKTCKFEGGNV